MNRTDRRAWSWCRTLPDLGEMGARWLEGRVKGQPAYCYPDPGEPHGPDEETCPLIPVLAAANRAGYLTNGSQPGFDGPGWDGRRWQQRAAVTGFADGPTAVRLTDLARSYRLLAAARPSTAWRVRYRDAISVTKREGTSYTSFGAVLPRRDLRDGHMGYGECRKDAVRAVCDAWQVTLIDMKWGREDSPLWACLADFAGLVVAL